jgi:phosphoglucosamine mutase
MLAHATAAGLLASGAHVIWGGVLPTPAVAYLTRVLGIEAGVVVSASHNAYTDNGLKYFAKDGYKLSDQLERTIESLFETPMQLAPSSGMSTVLPDGAQRYHDFLRTTVPNLDLRGLRLVIDTAHGATYDIGPRLLESFGATMIAIHHTPNGRNINAGCGATHPATLVEAVQTHQAD